MKHTPGPWTIEPVFIAQITCGPLHFGEYRFPHERTLEGSSKVYPREEAEANARLIAAAPELLAALRSTLSTLDFAIRKGVIECHGVREFALRAIAKAEEPC